MVSMNQQRDVLAFLGYINGNRIQITRSNYATVLCLVFNSVYCSSERAVTKWGEFGGGLQDGERIRSQVI